MTCIISGASDAEGVGVHPLSCKWFLFIFQWVYHRCMRHERKL